jgi:glycerol-3-phosphate acyltransferase PlsX
MRIVVDAMGGDGAPAVEVEGAVEALRTAREDFQIRLVGDESRVRAEIERVGAGGDSRLSIVHAPERIEMGEDPARQVRRKKGASIAVATRLLKSGEADGLVSAGNTGAVVASSLLTLGRIPVARRPKSRDAPPSPTGGAVLWTSARTRIARRSILVQFAVMGSSTRRSSAGRTDPKVTRTSARRARRETGWCKRPTPCCSRAP